MPSRRRSAKLSPGSSGVHPTTEQFLGAARMHLRGALAASKHNGGEPRVSSYLAHIAVECAIKYRILRNLGRTRTADVASLLGDRFRSIFSSRDGHDLTKLSQHASLQRLLDADNKANLLDSDDWKRMIHADRPYSLRYGTEAIATQTSNSEIVLVTSLLETLLRV